MITWGAVTLNQGGGACHGIGSMQIFMAEFDLVWALDAIRSPDEDGDGIVALADLTIWQQAFANQNPVHHGDLDCDLSSISLADLVVWQRHFVAP